MRIRMQGGPARLLAGVSRGAWVEIAVLLVAAVTADRFITGGLAGISPHPLWGVVLLAACQHGLGAGVGAAFGATIVFTILRPHADGLEFDHYEMLWRAAATPMLWLTAGVSLGWLRSRHKAMLAGAEQRAKAAAQREREMEAAVGQATRVNRKLEETVAGNLRSAVTLYRAAQGVEKLEPLEVLAGARSLVRAGLAPDRFSLYLLDGRRLIGVAWDGWESDPAPVTYTTGSELFRAVAGERRTLCAARPADRAVLGSEGVLAGPLVEEETGEILGMLKIEEAGFPALNLAAIQNFEVICRWIAKAYWKALLHQDSHLSQAFNVRTGILSHAFYAQQSLFLQRVASRIGFPLTALTVRLADGGQLHEPERAALAGILGGAVQQVLRGVDLAFEGEHAGHSYTILLVNTTAGQARIVGRRLEQELRRRLLPTAIQARFAFRINVMNEGAAEVTVEREAQSLAAIKRAVSESQGSEPGLFPGAGFEEAARRA